MTDEILFRGSGGGRALEVGGDLLLFKASRDEGFDSLFIELTSPPGGGPPPHTDPSEELFYVLEGEFEFVSPGPEGLTTRRLQVGDSVCVPRGAPHTYRNVGDSTGRLLVFFPQNERIQGFFEELGEPVADPSSWTSSGPPPLERVMARLSGGELPSPVRRPGSSLGDLRACSSTRGGKLRPPRAPRGRKPEC